MVFHSGKSKLINYKTYPFDIDLEGSKSGLLGCGRALVENLDAVTREEILH